MLKETSPERESRVDRSEASSRLYLLVGVPGSGKTTYARRRLPDALRVSLDDLRVMLSGRLYDPHYEPMVAVAGQVVLNALAARASKWQMDLIFDATNATRYWRSRGLSVASRHGLVPVAVFFDCSLETALQRNRQRPEPVPDEVIQRFYAQLEPPSKDEGFAEVWQVPCD